MRFIIAAPTNDLKDKILARLETKVLKPYLHRDFRLILMKRFTDSSVNWLTRVLGENIRMF